MNLNLILPISTSLVNFLPTIGTEGLSLRFSLITLSRYFNSIICFIVAGVFESPKTSSSSW